MTNFDALSDITVGGRTGVCDLEGGGGGGVTTLGILDGLGGMMVGGMKGGIETRVGRGTFCVKSFRASQLSLENSFATGYAAPTVKSHNKVAPNTVRS